LIGTNSTINVATLNGPLADASAQADVVVDPAANQQAGVIVRASNSGMYYGQIRSTGSGFVANIIKYTSLGATTGVQLNSVSVAVGGGSGTVRLEAAGPSLKLFFNNVLMVYAYDSSATPFTTGFTGVRATKGLTTSIDNFTVNAITLAPAAVPFNDAFDTPNNTDQLSLNWTERAGNFTVTGTQELFANAPGMSLATVNGASFLDEAAQVDIVSGTPSQNTGLILRHQSNGRFYLASITGNAAQTVFTPNFYKFIPGTGFVLIASTKLTPVGAIGTMRFEIVGSSLKLFWNGSLAAYGYDSTITTPGFMGLRVSSGLTLDNFVADEIVQTSPTITFNESFNLPVNGDQLSRDWTERRGNFAINGSEQLVSMDGGAGLNLATVNGASFANAAAEIGIVAGAASQNTGLVLRYQNLNTYYVGGVLGNAAQTVFTPYITRFVNGVATSLALTVVAPVAGTGTLRFEAVGNNLKLFWNGALAAYTYDSSIAAAGLPGLRVSKGLVFDDFVAEEIQPSTPGLPVNEQFGSPIHGDQLSRDWDERQGNFNVNGSNQAVATGNGVSIATVHGHSFVDAFISADITLGNNQFAGVMARYLSNSKYYLAQLQANATGTALTPRIYVVFNGVMTQLATAPAIAITAGTAHNLNFEVAGTSLKLFVDGNLAAYAYDNRLTAAGNVGIRASKNATFGIVQANAIDLLTPSPLPFTDDFAQATNTPLTREWSERQGLFSDVSGNDITAIAPTGISIATVNGPLADSSSQIDVNISGVGTHNNGLVARFNPANGNTYIGTLSTVNGVTSALIQKRIGGVFTTIGQGSVGAIGAGTVRFDVVAGSLKLFYTPNAGATQLVAYAIDSSITAPGLSGIYVRAGDTVDEFFLNSITLNPVTLDFADNFNGNNGDQLSLSWLDRKGNYSVFGNKMVGKAALNVATLNGVAAPSVRVDAEIIVGPSQSAGVIARYQISNGSYYTAVVSSNAPSAGFTAYIYRVDAGVQTKLASAPVASGTGTLSLRVVGSNLKLFYGATLATQSLIAYAYDTKYTTGTAGIRSSAGSNLDNFAASVVNVPTSQPANFSEIFAASPPTHQLSNNWQERIGNFNTSTGPATGKAAFNLATVQGINSANADLSAVVNLVSQGDYAILVARYTATPNGGTYYYAKVTHAGASGYAIGIYKVVNGVTTLLSLPNLFVASFAGDMQFLVVNGNLNLYLDGSNLAAVTVSDTAITGSGAVGFGTNANVKVTSFEAN
jgi:hypothetical protein